MKTALLVLAFAFERVLCFGRVFGSSDAFSKSEEGQTLSLSSYGSSSGLETSLDGLLVLPEGSERLCSLFHRHSRYDMCNRFIHHEPVILD